MKKIGLFTAAFVAFSGALNAQENKQAEDAKSIKEMCGCFEVGFNFSETFVFSEDTTYMPSKNKETGALELAILIEDEDDKVSIQHLLVVGGGDNQMVIKHWRQDWLYENIDLYTYNGDNEWKFQQKEAEEVEGQWTQKVYQVDDSPRYEGSGSWVSVDGKVYWENTTDAPLPRREYTQRSDYNVTVRGNRQEIVEDGWIHDQDNLKVVREEGAEDVVIAAEKGYNTYKKVDISKCKVAQDWWNEQEAYWALVRKAWDEVYSENKDLKLAEKVDGKRLYEVLFIDDVSNVKFKSIKKTIQSFVI